MKYETPYWEASNEQYERITDGMSEGMKRGFANALAHHLMPMKRNEHGYWMSRWDIIGDTRSERSRWWLLNNDGQLIYNPTDGAPSYTPMNW